jgi:hypothetical protein
MLAFFLYTEPMSEKRKKMRELQLKETTKVTEDQLNQETVTEELGTEDTQTEKPPTEDVQTCFDTVPQHESSFESSEDESILHDLFSDPVEGPEPDKKKQ